MRTGKIVVPTASVDVKCYGAQLVLLGFNNSNGIGFLACIPVVVLFFPSMGNRDGARRLSSYKSPGVVSIAQSNNTGTIYSPAMYIRTLACPRVIGPRTIREDADRSAYLNLPRPGDFTCFYSIRCGSSLPRGVIGSRLVRGGNLRGLDGDRQAVVHDLGGNCVRAGLVGVHIGVHTADGVEHAARLEAVVGGHGELDLGLGREINRILVLGDRLLGAVRVGVLERRVRDLDRYLSGGVLLDRGGVALGKTPLREVVLVALGPSGLVGLLVVRGLRVSRGVRGGVRGRIRRIIPLVHRGVGPLGGGPLRGGRLVLGVHRAVLDDLLLSVGRDAELLSDRRDVHGGDGHRCDEHAHQRTLGTHAMLFREVPAFFPKVLP